LIEIDGFVKNKKIKVFFENKIRVRKLSVNA